MTLLQYVDCAGRVAVARNPDPLPNGAPPGAFTEGEEGAARQLLFNQISPVYDEVRAWKKALPPRARSPLPVAPMLKH